MEDLTTTTGTTSTRILRGPDQKGWYWGTGRRKTAVARVRIKTGTGAVEVNGKRDAVRVFLDSFRQSPVSEIVAGASG
jgi:ribosomal protein S9